MKHAMMMTMHNNVGILRLFVDLFDDERYDFYILVDAKSSLTDEELNVIQAKYSKIVFLPRKKIFWGGYSLIDALMELMSESSKKHYDYYHFFQGSDFPIKTKDDVDSFFTKNKGKEFVNIYKNDFSVYKCCYYHLFVERATYRKNVVWKALNHLCVKLQKIFGISRNRDLDLYHGSSLYSLTHNFVEYILDRRSRIEEKFRFALAADEVFLQTLIASSAYKENIYRFEDSYEANCRAIDWKRRDGNSPYTFTMEDYEFLINSGEGICFCRKIDEKNSMELVSNLYQYLKQKGEV